MPLINCEVNLSLIWSVNCVIVSTNNTNQCATFEPKYQGVNKLFILAFEDDAKRTSNKRYYLPNVEIKDYSAMIDGKNFFAQPAKIIK